MNTQNHRTQSDNRTLRRFMDKFSDDFELDKKLADHQEHSRYTKKI